MDLTIIVALIAVLGGIATQLVIAIVNKKATTAIINYRVDALEVKVMKYNNLIERMYCVEEKVTQIEKRID